MSIFNINDFKTEQNFTLEELDDRFVNSDGDIIENLTARNIQLYDSSNIIFGDSTVQTSAFSQEYKDGIQTQMANLQPINILPLANIFTNEMNTFKQINVDKLQLNGLPRHAYIDVLNKDLELISANTNSKIKLIINKNNFGYSETEYTLSRDSLHCNNKDIAGVKQLIFNNGSVQNTAFTDTNKLQLETVAQQLTDITYEPTNDITIINNKLNVVGDVTLNNNSINGVNIINVNQLVLNGTSTIRFSDGSTMNTAPVSTDLSSLNSQIQTLNTKTTNLSFNGTSTIITSSTINTANIGTLYLNNVNVASRLNDITNLQTRVGRGTMSLNYTFDRVNFRTSSLSFIDSTFLKVQNNGFLIKTAGLFYFSFGWKNELQLSLGGYEDITRFNYVNTSGTDYLTLSNLYGLSVSGGGNFNNQFDNHADNPKLRYKNIKDANGNFSWDITTKYNDDGLQRRGNGYFVNFTIYLNVNETFFIQFKAGNNALKMDGQWYYNYLSP